MVRSTVIKEFDKRTSTNSIELEKSFHKAINEQLHNLKYVADRWTKYWLKFIIPGVHICERNTYIHTYGVYSRNGRSKRHFLTD